MGCPTHEVNKTRKRLQRKQSRGSSAPVILHRCPCARLLIHISCRGLEIPGELSPEPATSDGSKSTTIRKCIHCISENGMRPGMKQSVREFRQIGQQKSLLLCAALFSLSVPLERQRLQTAEKGPGGSTASERAIVRPRYCDRRRMFVRTMHVGASRISFAAPHLLPDVNSLWNRKVIRTAITH